MLQPYLSSFQNGVILYSNVVTFGFMISYMKEVLSNIGKNALRRKNGQFQHEMWWIYQHTDLRYWGDTKNLCGYIWNSSRFFRGSKLKYLPLWQHFGLWPSEKSWKIKVFLSPQDKICLCKKSLVKPGTHRMRFFFILHSFIVYICLCFAQEHMRA